MTMKISGNKIAYSIVIGLVVITGLCCAAVYQMGYNTAHHREKDINNINQIAFDSLHNARSQYKDIIITRNEAIKNCYDKDSVFDIDLNDFESAKFVLEHSFPLSGMTEGYMYPIDRYFKQYIGLIENGRKRIMIYLTTDYNPEYPGQLVLYKGLPPENVTIGIDLTTDAVTVY